MPYVIAAPCVADSTCIDICPVDCISPRLHDDAFDDAEQLYINPETCIGCGACVDVCPVLAIYDSGSLPDKWRHYAGINRDYFLQTPEDGR